MQRLQTVSFTSVFSLLSERKVISVVLPVVDGMVGVVGCRQRGIDARRSYIASLCMEEMAGNIVEHGFTKDKKQHSADIRVVHKDDTVILRIRDNCVAFDPAERLRIMEKGKNGKNFGIKLVYGIATEVTYQNLLGLNVLTIRI